MARVIVFDVNETLLDLKALDPHFQRIFGDANVRQHWFQQVLQTSLVVTVTDSYVDFGQVAAAALAMTAARQGVTLSEDDRKSILGTIRTLPPHPDVIESLELLQSAGLRLATLTNSPPHVVEAQLQNAGLSAFFEQSLSVDSVRRFKPAAEVYQMAAAKLGVAPGTIRLVAAHDWDVAGAMHAGCAAAFIARPGMVLSPLMDTPDIIGADLREVTERILQIEI